MNQKNILKKASYRFLSIIAGFALMLTTFNVSTACWFIMHQDEIPQEAKKLRKF